MKPRNYILLVLCLIGVALFIWQINSQEQLKTPGTQTELEKGPNASRIERSIRVPERPYTVRTGFSPDESVDGILRQISESPDLVREITSTLTFLDSIHKSLGAPKNLHLPIDVRQDYEQTIREMLAPRQIQKLAQICRAPPMIDYQEGMKELDEPDTKANLLNFLASSKDEPMVGDRAVALKNLYLATGRQALLQDLSLASHKYSSERAPKPKNIDWDHLHQQGVKLLAFMLKGQTVEQIKDLTVLFEDPAKQAELRLRHQLLLGLATGSP